MRRLLTRVNVTILLAAAAGYLFVLPCFWPKPTPRITLPARATLDRDLSLTVEVRALHPNWELTEVRFFANYGDNPATTATPLYPVYLRQRPARRAWPRLTLNRLTCPRQRRFTYAVPLARLAREGKLQPGMLHGSIDVSITHPNILFSKYGPPGAYWARTDRYAIPFAIELSASQAGGGGQ